MKSRRPVNSNIMWLAKIFGDNDIKYDLNDEVRRCFERCPACESGFENHYIAPFAVTVATPQNSTRTTEFFRALKEHRWSDAKTFQEFEGAHNAAVAKVLRCPTGPLVLFAIRDPVELFESSTILGYEVLTSEAGNALNSEIAPDQWQRLCETVAT